MDNTSSLKATYIDLFLPGLVSVICNQRPAFQPEAINDDHRSMSQDLIFDAVSNYYLKVKKLEDVYKQGDYCRS